MFVCRILESATDWAQTQVGTCHYMSPELFMGIKYNFKVGVGWMCLSAIIYKMLTTERRGA